nr:translation initiation factor IF-2-like [Aegilops tauschii subsp. strangulata]
MDRSRGSSSEALSGQKRRREGSAEGEVDLEYEAALRSKLQADRARAEGAAVEPGGAPSLGSGSVAAGPSAPPGGSSSRPWTPGRWRPRRVRLALLARYHGPLLLVVLRAPARAPAAPGGGPGRFVPRGSSGAQGRRPSSGGLGPASASGPVGDGILPPPPPLRRASLLLPKGFRLRVRVEGDAALMSPPPPPPRPASGNDDKDDKDEDGLSDDSNPGAEHRFTQSEWDGLTSEDRDLLKENAPVGGGNKDAVDGAGGGVAASDGARGTPFSGVCSNLPSRPASPSLSGIEDLPPSGPMTKKKKKKSSVKKFSARSRASGDSKQFVAGLCRRLDADLGAASGRSSAAASPCRVRPVQVCSPASTARKSGRVSNSGERVADRAAWRAAARDLPPSDGTPCFLGPPFGLCPSWGLIMRS